jgi:hypothetical protein
MAVMEGANAAPEPDIGQCGKCIRVVEQSYQRAAIVDLLGDDKEGDWVKPRAWP